MRSVLNLRVSNSSISIAFILFNGSLRRPFEFAKLGRHSAQHTYGHLVSHSSELLHDFETASIRRSCSADEVAMIPRSKVSRYRPPAPSRGDPPASGTFPPASSTTITPAAWSQIFSLYPALGNLMYTSASARATDPYFTWLYTRNGLLAIARLSATLAVNPCDEFAFITGSQNFAVLGSNSSLTLTGTGSTFRDASHGDMNEPWPFTAVNKHPLNHPKDSPASILDTNLGENPYV